MTIIFKKSFADDVVKFCEDEHIRFKTCKAKDDKLWEITFNDHEDFIKVQKCLDRLELIEETY